MNWWRFTGLVWCVILACWVGWMLERTKHRRLTDQHIGPRLAEIERRLDALEQRTR